MPQVTLVYLALAAALASLVLIGWKLWTDRHLRDDHLALVRTERAIRENYERNESLKRDAFEQGQAAAARAHAEQLQSCWEQFSTSEQNKRQDFATTERTLRARFMSSQDSALVAAEARIKQEIESYVRLEKWREESWHRNLSRLDQASKDLMGTTAGLMSLIDEGPFLCDARMVQETARVLDVFGDFQTSVTHFAMPAEMAELSQELIRLITQILLSLSPHQAVRESADYKARLMPMRAALKRGADGYLRRCGDFERDPSVFLCG